jgi:hypothetical protein
MDAIQRREGIYLSETCGNQTGDINPAKRIAVRESISRTPASNMKLDSRSAR